MAVTATSQACSCFEPSSKGARSCIERVATSTHYAECVCMQQHSTAQQQHQKRSTCSTPAKQVTHTHSTCQLVAHVAHGSLNMSSITLCKHCTLAAQPLLCGPDRNQTGKAPHTLSLQLPLHPKRSQTNHPLCTLHQHRPIPANCVQTTPISAGCVHKVQEPKESDRWRGYPNNVQMTL